MSDDSVETLKSPPRKWLVPLLILAVISLAAIAGDLFFQRNRASYGQGHTAARLENERRQRASEKALFDDEIELLKTATERREKEIAAREGELRQREASIAGREDAATERTQSSFQGLLIQQNLLKNLEALKASLPDMTPEMERLTREHAQFDAEVQRLRKENAELRRKLNTSALLESR